MLLIRKIFLLLFIKIQEIKFRFNGKIIPKIVLFSKEPDKYPMMPCNVICTIITIIIIHFIGT